MIINLSDVLTEQHKPVETTVELELKEFQIRSGSYSIVEKSSVWVRVTHVKDKELKIQGRTEVVIRIPCDRCLEDTNQKFSLDFVKYVDLSVGDAELKEGYDESDYIEGYHLDVDKMIFNEILTGWPTKILCKEDCKGICSVCGQNLNVSACDCEDTGLDPRMSVVRDLFKNFKEV